MDIQGFDAESLKKMNKAFEVLEKVVNSNEFKDRVINFKNTQNERSFASNNGLTNEQIFEIFMEGRETLQQNTPGEMNFFLKLYHRPFSKVIGWTSGNINTININWKFYLVIVLLFHISIISHLSAEKKLSSLFIFLPVDLT
jgi:hypothetical protein